MTMHVGLPSRWAARLPGHRRLRHVATGAAALAALLYVLMGVVASIALAFSLVMGGIFAAATVFLLVFDGRRVWIPVALLDLGAIVGYFAVAGTRDPHFEIWGLAIKASQVVLLAALGYLIIRDSRAPRRG